MLDFIIKTIMNPEALVSIGGAFGVMAIIFLETGAFFGFFFPGDTLLFTAGFLASKGLISLPLLLVGTFIAAVIGDSVGYAFGKKIGPTLFNREDSTFFNKKHITKAQHFYEKHGRKTIILARFLPIVRTFAPIVAGIGKMEYSKFLTFNVIGGFLWTWLMLWLGYGFASVVPDPDRFIIPVIILIILFSAIPTIREVLKGRN